VRPTSYRIGYQGETQININSVEVHPQLSITGYHPVDGIWVGECWFTMAGELAMHWGGNLANFSIKLVKRDLSNEESNALKLRWGLCNPKP